MYYMFFFFFLHTAACLFLCFLPWGQCHYPFFLHIHVFMSFYVPACVLGLREWVFIFTHSIAVHEKDPEWLSAPIFQTEEEGIVSVEVMRSLQGRQRDRGMRGDIGTRCEAQEGRGRLIEAKGVTSLPNQLTRHSIISPLGRRLHMLGAHVNMTLINRCSHKS